MHAANMQNRRFQTRAAIANASDTFEYKSTAVHKLEMSIVRAEMSALRGVRNTATMIDYVELAYYENYMTMHCSF